jgi:hypothetical protein
LTVTVMSAVVPITHSHTGYDTAPGILIVIGYGTPREGSMSLATGLGSQGVDREACYRWVSSVLGVDLAPVAVTLANSAAVNPNLFGSPAAKGPPGQPPPAGSSSPQTAPPPPTPEQVRTVQSALSKWRIANGGAAINASGNLDQVTKDAIIEFQRQSGLHPQDGTFSPALANRLSVMLKIQEHYPNSIGDPKLEELTGGAGFGSMDQQSQDATLARMQSYVQDVSTLH